MFQSKRCTVHAVWCFFALPVMILAVMAFSSQGNSGNSNESNTIHQISFVWPIANQESFVVHSGYGERLHPVLGVRRLHTGIDLVADEGVPVISARDGVVVKAEMAEAWGNLIIIRHNRTYSTLYSHMKSINVKPGDKVKEGDVIGLVGHTGLSSRDHLHFEVHKNGKAVDPAGYLPTK